MGRWSVLSLPSRFRWDEADADGGHQGVAVAGADRLFRYLLFSARDIADDLCPEAVLGEIRQMTRYGGMTPAHLWCRWSKDCCALVI